MKTKKTLMFVIGLVIFSCNTKHDDGKNDEVSGAYSREYSFKVLNPETGNEIGMRTVRDTILIRRVENGYEVSNRKWGLNDYDKEDWRNMEHAEDRPMPTIFAKWDIPNSTLVAESTALYLDLKNGTLSKGKASYRKIKSQ